MIFTPNRHTAVRGGRSDYTPSRRGFTLSCHWFELRGWLIRLKCSERSEKARAHTHNVSTVQGIELWKGYSLLPCDLETSEYLIDLKRGKGKIPRSPRLMDKTSGQLNGVIKRCCSLVGIQLRTFRKLCSFFFFFFQFLFYPLSLQAQTESIFSLSDGVEIWQLVIKSHIAILFRIHLSSGFWQASVSPSNVIGGHPLLPVLARLRPPSDDQSCYAAAPLYEPNPKLRSLNGHKKGTFSREQRQVLKGPLSA